MSFVEGLSAASPDVAGSAFVVCAGGVLLVLGLLLAVPALAAVLSLLRVERNPGKLLWDFIMAHYRANKK
jgi:hypothetical protein